MIRAFLISFTFGILMISIAHNSYQMQKSFDRCEVLVQQIHQHAENLKNL